MRLNRALHVGRIDPLVKSLLARLETARLALHFHVVGTHALYAYEAAAGVLFEADAVATRDIDLLWDVSRRVQFQTAPARRQVDAGGAEEGRRVAQGARRSQKYTAVNKDGFEVDILRRQPIDGDPYPVRLSDDEDDFWVAQAPNANLLRASVSAVIVASTGAMARMNTLHPLAFARFKHWTAQLRGRDAKKRSRDELQATAVEAVVRKYLPHLEADFVSLEIPRACQHDPSLSTHP